MLARIYKPVKSAMQQGRANTTHWFLELEASAAKRLDPLMGWTGSSDTGGQVRLRFDDLAEAVEFAKRRNLAYTVLPTHERKLKIKSYAENFK